MVLITILKSSVSSRSHLRSRSIAESRFCAGIVEPSILSNKEYPMKRFFRCCTVVLGAGIGLFLLAGLILYAVGMQKFTESYPDIPVEAVTIPTEAAAIERGQHIASTWSCTYCHGDDLSGELVEEDALMGTVPATNLTSGNGGIGQS